MSSEAQEQMKVVEWCRTTAYRLHKTTRAGVGLIIHIPNGGLRSKREAAQLKAAGVVAGVSDLFLPVPTKQHHGLWLEMKTAGGSVAPAQESWIEDMQKAGYGAAIAWSADEAIQIIKDYLGEAYEPS